MDKPYKAKSLAGAQRRVRALLKQRAHLISLLERYVSERKALAKLAAKGPAFSNPLEAFAAEKVRDAVLNELGMNPDGSFLEVAGRDGR